MGKIIDMTGERYGRLLVIEKVSKKGEKNSRWLCRCDCGTEIIVSRPNLLSNKTTSCGCIRKEKKKTVSKPTWIDETGHVYGLLTVLDKSQKTSSSGNALWKCRCQCGKITLVSSNNLRSGRSRSCGCTMLRTGEKTVKSLLEQNNLSFTEQKTFNACRFPNTNALARFDFYVENKYLIEYDGEQHFGIGGWGEDFDSISQRDKFKNQWCKDNNIPLIRIPYTHLEKLCIDDLKLETSNFVIDKEVNLNDRD